MAWGPMGGQWGEEPLPFLSLVLLPGARPAVSSGMGCVSLGHGQGGGAASLLPRLRAVGRWGGGEGGRQWGWFGVMGGGGHAAAFDAAPRPRPPGFLSMNPPRGSFFFLFCLSPSLLFFPSPLRTGPP